METLIYFVSLMATFYLLGISRLSDANRDDAQEPSSIDRVRFRLIRLALWALTVGAGLLVLFIVYGEFQHLRYQNVVDRIFRFCLLGIVSGLLANWILMRREFWLREGHQDLFRSWGYQFRSPDYLAGISVILMFLYSIFYSDIASLKGSIRELQIGGLGVAFTDGHDASSVSESLPSGGKETTSGFSGTRLFSVASLLTISDMYKKDFNKYGGYLQEILEDNIDGIISNEKLLSRNGGNFKSSAFENPGPGKFVLKRTHIAHAIATCIVAYDKLYPDALTNGGTTADRLIKLSRFLIPPKRDTVSVTQTTEERRKRIDEFLKSTTKSLMHSLREDLLFDKEKSLGKKDKNGAEHVNFRVFAKNCDGQDNLLRNENYADILESDFFEPFLGSLRSNENEFVIDPYFQIFLSRILWIAGAEKAAIIYLKSWHDYYISASTEIGAQHGRYTSKSALYASWFAIRTGIDLVGMLDYKNDYINSTDVAQKNIKILRLLIQFALRSEGERIINIGKFDEYCHLLVDPNDKRILFIYLNALKTRHDQVLRSSSEFEVEQHLAQSDIIANSYDQCFSDFWTNTGVSSDYHDRFSSDFKRTAAKFHIARLARLLGEKEGDSGSIQKHGLRALSLLEESKALIHRIRATIGPDRNTLGENKRDDLKEIESEIEYLRIVINN